MEPLTLPTLSAISQQWRKIWWITFSNEKQFFSVFCVAFPTQIHTGNLTAIFEKHSVFSHSFSFLHEAHFNADQPVIYLVPQNLNVVTFPSTLPLPASRFNLSGRGRLHHLSPQHVPHPSIFSLSLLCAGHGVCGAAQAEVRTRQLWSLPVTSACDLRSERAGKQPLPLLAFSLWSRSPTSLSFECLRYE